MVDERDRARARLGLPPLSSASAAAPAPIVDEQSRIQAMRAAAPEVAADDSYYTKKDSQGKTQAQRDALKNALKTAADIRETSTTRSAYVDPKTGKVVTMAKGIAPTAVATPTPASTSVVTGNADTTDTATLTGQTYIAPDGRIFTDLAAYNSYIQKAKAEEKRRQGQSAYDILFNEFDKYGLGSLVSEVQQYIVDGLSPAEFTIKLRASKPYQERFAANAKRIANGFQAIDEATYLDLEDSYQSIMQNYGLPPTYYQKGNLGVQKGFEKFIAGNVDPVTLEERIIEGQKVSKGNSSIIAAAKKFFPNLTDGDFLAYVLDPENALSEIKRKVTAAEIGGAQIGAGLEATLANAETLATAGVTGKQYQQAAPTIAEAALRGGQLAEIYKQSPYTQQTAEQAVLDVPGSAEALKRTKRLSSLESAAFSGSAGAGAIARDRAGVL